MEASSQKSPPEPSTLIGFIYAESSMNVFAFTPYSFETNLIANDFIA